MKKKYIPLGRVRERGGKRSIAKWGKKRLGSRASEVLIKEIGGAIVRAIL